MMMRRVRTLGIVLLLTGCAAEDRGSRPEPLVLVDSVVLQEPDSVPIGQLGGATLDGAGRVYVTDPSAGRIATFNRDGSFRSAIGRKGGGPGELGAPGPVTVLGDTLLVVFDVSRLQPVLFSTGDGAWRGTGRAIGAPMIVLSVRAHHDDVWIGYVDPRRRTAAARWRAGTDSAVLRVALPAAYQGTGLEYAHGYSHVMPWPDTLLVGLTASPHLLLTDTAGTLRDTITVPVRERRGVPADLSEIYRRDGIGENEVSILSILWGLHRLSTGAVVLVHLDMTPASEFGRMQHTDAFVTLLALDGSRGCIDLRLPVVEDGRPVFTFRGDSLMMLEQRVTEDGRAAIVMRTYALSDAACSPVAR